FANPVTYPTTGTGAYHIAFGDFNGDNKLDIAVPSANSNDVSVLLGNGDGTFGTATKVNVGTFPDAVAVGDFNGDGKLDLITAHDTSTFLAKLTGDGAGGFTASNQNVTAGVTSNKFVVVTDLNFDGVSDIIYSGNTQGSVGVQLGINPTTTQLNAA